MSKKHYAWIAVGMLLLGWAIGFTSAYALSLYPIRILVDKEAGQVWPAWVQAVGSIAAIIAAAAIAFFQRYFERKDSNAAAVAQARSMAGLLYDDVKQWRSRIQLFPRGAIGTSTNAASIPDLILTNADRLHLLGTTSGPLITAIRDARNAQSKGGDPAFRRDRNEKVFLVTDEDIDNFNLHIHAAGQRLDEVIGGFDKLLS